MLKNILLNLRRGKNLWKTRTFLLCHFQIKSLVSARTSWFISPAQQEIDTAKLLGVEWEVRYSPLKFLAWFYSWAKYIFFIRNKPHGYTTLLRQPGWYHSSDPAQETTVSGISSPKISVSYYLTTLLPVMYATLEHLWC